MGCRSFAETGIATYLPDPDAALFLVGERAGFVTGSDMLVDGGYTAV